MGTRNCQPVQLTLPLDFPHHYEKSTTEGHTHLYLDVGLTRWRWFILMCALRYAGVIELGFFVWSVRRGSNFVRVPDATKTKAESVVPEYGWFKKMRKS